MNFFPILSNKHNRPAMYGTGVLAHRKRSKGHDMFSQSSLQWHSLQQEKFLHSHFDMHQMASRLFVQSICTCTLCLMSKFLGTNAIIAKKFH